jgi:thiamine-monophosphate kinase
LKLKELGEFGLIDRIARQVYNAPSVVLGIGDDAAALLPAPGTLTLVTSDMLLEGVHFDLSFTDPQSLGRKSLSVNLSDLAAMGAQPRQFLLSIALPTGLSLDIIDGFMTGVLEQAERFGATLVGGDTCASLSGLVISITAMGEQVPQRVVKRSGARAGDLVCVTGTLGDSAAGLQALRKGVREGFLVSRHLDPQPRVAVGVALAEAGVVSAMIDVSDGVLGDLGHICELSGVGARLQLGQLPLSEEYRASCTGDDPYGLALSGGEDYELLFCVPEANRGEAAQLVESLGVPFTVIGEVVAGGGIELVLPGGGSYTPKGRGFDHFG